MVIVVVTVVVGGVLAAVLLTGGHGAKNVSSNVGGRLAPAFRLPNLRDGQDEISLASFRGHPVLVNFWATWCQPCTQEMPLLQAAHKRVGGAVVFLGVDRQDYRPQAQSFLQQTGVTYASAYDKDGTLDGAYRLRGMPTSVFIDAAGRIHDQITGPLTRAQLDDELAALTGGRR